jgi:hypothetical protein
MARQALQMLTRIVTDAAAFGSLRSESQPPGAAAICCLHRRLRRMVVIATK